MMCSQCHCNKNSIGLKMVECGILIFAYLKIRHSLARNYCITIHNDTINSFHDYFVILTNS